MESYREWSDKGDVIDGRRITILTGSLVYQVNEEVRIAHVMEATQPGHGVYVMGLKQVFAEYINGVLQGEALPDDQSDPFLPLEYDGRVLDSPATDFNYDVSVYSFVEPGDYEICWKPGKWISNTLKIEVME
jgi:hypothetical protein